MVFAVKTNFTKAILPKHSVYVLFYFFICESFFIFIIPAVVDMLQTFQCWLFQTHQAALYNTVVSSESGY